MAHTLTDFEIIDDIDDNYTRIRMLWSIIEIAEEPIKVLLAKYGIDLVKRYFIYDYMEYIKKDN